jgi:DNA-3-methyladenine glycosylase II
VVAEVHGDAAPDRVRAQLARLLSLDVDGTGWPAVGARDPVVGDLQRRFAGLRPVGFWSPYEAAVWSVLSARVRMTQAAAVKARIAEAHGERVRVGDGELAAFPVPAALRALPAIAGVGERALGRLHAVAGAALEGRLDGARLRALDPDAALAELRTIPGIGPFAAELVLLRGAGHPDRFPRAERRVHAAMAAAYGTAADDLDALEAIAGGWRPYRTWAALHLRAGAAQSA